MDVEDFMARNQFLLVTNVWWKALHYLDQIELLSVTPRQASLSNDENFSFTVKLTCQKTIIDCLMKNINFIMTQLTFSVNVYTAVFKSVLNVYPEECIYDA